MSPLRLARYVWALPNTLLGLVLGGLSFQLPRRLHGAAVFDRRARGFIWLFGAVTRFRAVTFGHVILATRRLEGKLLFHELAHVRQYEAFGPAYLPAYVLLFLLRGYRRHPLEVAAERRAVQAVTRERGAQAPAATPSDGGATRAGPSGGPA